MYTGLNTSHMNRTSLQTSDTRQISYHMILTKYLVFTISWTSCCLRAWPLSLFGASDFLWLGKGGGGGAVDVQMIYTFTPVADGDDSVACISLIL